MWALVANVRGVCQRSRGQLALRSVRMGVRLSSGRRARKGALRRTRTWPPRSASASVTVRVTDDCSENAPGYQGQCQGQGQPLS